MFYNPDTRELLRTRPNPLTPEEVERLRGQRRGCRRRAGRSSGCRRRRGSCIRISPSRGGGPVCELRRAASAVGSAPVGVGARPDRLPRSDAVADHDLRGAVREGAAQVAVRHTGSSSSTPRSAPGLSTPSRGHAAPGQARAGVGITCARVGQADDVGFVDEVVERGGEARRHVRDDDTQSDHSGTDRTQTPRTPDAPVPTAGHGADTHGCTSPEIPSPASPVQTHDVSGGRRGSPSQASATVPFR
jgi:hypothetical protein